MRAMKVLVISMGIAIIAGVGVLVTAIVTRLDALQVPVGTEAHSGAAPVDIWADVPAGARLLDHSLSGDRLVLDLALADGGRALAIVEIGSGRRVALVRMPGP
ncbi:MAG: hypothetical protein JNK11_07125 [Alphaproteobacteria bacterium]|nr:hypothetical protein [Alphaproteobacteria bacterium]